MKQALEEYGMSRDVEKTMMPKIIQFKMGNWLNIVLTQMSGKALLTDVLVFVHLDYDDSSILIHHLFEIMRHKFGLSTTVPVISELMLTGTRT